MGKSFIVFFMNVSRFSASCNSLRAAAGSDGAIVVAMSGGVDSSVVAGLLRRSGRRVIGITLQLYDERKKVSQSSSLERGASSKSCCAGRDIADARNVARALDIPHYVLDFEDRFRHAVIDDFLASYRKGETPLPCVRCNQRIKFSALVDVAKGLGAVGLATGHYIRIERAPEGEARLYRARDTAKDQSYFLFATTREQLSFLHFPLGDMKKNETRELARTMGLANSDKVESQDICFVASRYTRLFPELLPQAAGSESEVAGDICDLSGNVLGRHAGIAGYTIGQRRGLGLGGLSSPMYVVGIDARRNIVTVGERSSLSVRGVILREINWLCDSVDAGVSISLDVKFRSLMDTVAARVSFIGDGGCGGEDARVEVIFSEPQIAVACGQACVFYDGERVLGGGIIDETLACDAAHEGANDACLVAAE